MQLSCKNLESRSTEDTSTDGGASRKQEKGMTEQEEDCKIVTVTRLAGLETVTAEAAVQRGSL